MHTHELELWNQINYIVFHINSYQSLFEIYQYFHKNNSPIDMILKTYQHKFKFSITVTFKISLSKESIKVIYINLHQIFTLKLLVLIFIYEKLICKYWYVIWNHWVEYKSMRVCYCLPKLNHILSDSYFHPFQPLPMCRFDVCTFHSFSWRRLSCFFSL